MSGEVVSAAHIFRERARSLMRLWGLATAVTLIAGFVALVLVGEGIETAWLVAWVGLAAGSLASATVLAVGGSILNGMADAADASSPTAVSSPPPR